MSDICMIYDESGNAIEAFDYEPDELERRAKDLRRERGELSVVTIGPSPFVTSSSAVLRTEEHT